MDEDGNYFKSARERIKKLGNFNSVWKRLDN